MSDKELFWFHADVKTPPFTSAARIESGTLLRRLQRGEKLSMPLSRPMPSIGARIHELRVRDEYKNWRIVYRIDSDTIIVVEVFAKTTKETPQAIIEVCRKRLASFDGM